jgi:hypothetical protein
MGSEAVSPQNAQVVHPNTAGTKLVAQAAKSETLLLSGLQSNETMQRRDPMFHEIKSWDIQDGRPETGLLVASCHDGRHRKFQEESVPSHALRPDTVHCLVFCFLSAVVALP